MGAEIYLVQREEFFGFFNHQLGDAVKARYLTKGDIHAKLAEYFGRSPFERRLMSFLFGFSKQSNGGLWLLGK